MKMATSNYVITGCSRGIGFEAARQLLQHPETRVLALSRSAEGLQRLRDTCDTDRLQALSYDLTRPDTDALIGAVEKMGKVNGLINNAGQLINKPFIETNREDWERLFGINLFATVDLIRSLSDHFAAGAHIVNISSMGGYQGSSKFPGLSAYSSSKAALASLTECLAEEWKDREIRVNCLALGAVNTEMLAEAFPGYEAPVSSEEMGSYFAWFVREGHRFYNGKILPVSVSTP